MFDEETGTEAGENAGSQESVEIGYDRNSQHPEERSRRERKDKEEEAKQERRLLTFIQASGKK